MEIFINDRLLAPNSKQTREPLDSELQAFCGRLFGGAEYSLNYGNDPRRLFTVYVKAADPVPVADLLANLSSQ